MINELAQQKRLLGEFRTQDRVYIPHLKMKGRIQCFAHPFDAYLRMENGSLVVATLSTPAKELIRVRSA